MGLVGKAPDMAQLQSRVARLNRIAADQARMIQSVKAGAVSDLPSVDDAQRRVKAKMATTDQRLSGKHLVDWLLVSIGLYCLTALVLGWWPQ